MVEKRLTSQSLIFRFSPLDLAMIDASKSLPKFEISLPIHQLLIKKTFDGLTFEGKLYAHHFA